MRFTIYGRLDGLNEYTRANRSNAYAGAQMKKRNQQKVYDALVGRIEKILYPVRLEIEWYEETKRRDKDNVAFAKKFILDALVAVGIIKGDSWDWIKGFEDIFYIDKENPRIEVNVIPVLREEDND